MKTTKLEKSIQDRNWLISQLTWIYRNGGQDRLSLSAILERVKIMVYESSRYKKTQKWVHSEINGASVVLLQLHYEFLEWACWYDGKFMGLTKDFKYTDTFDHNLFEAHYVYKGTDIIFN